jgi:protein involved in polysaccharide export with SLBB domain
MKKARAETKFQVSHLKHEGVAPSRPSHFQRPTSSFFPRRDALYAVLCVAGLAWADGAARVCHCRVGDDRAIVLPIRGPLTVRDTSPAHIETAIASHDYSKYRTAPLPGYAGVLKDRTQRVSIAGAAARPGSCALRHDRTSLAELLRQAGAFAGGLDRGVDLRWVSVYRLAPDGRIAGATFQRVHPHRAQQIRESLALPLTWADLVCPEHPARTRTDIFFDRLLWVRPGLYVDPLGGVG